MRKSLMLLALGALVSTASVYAQGKGDAAKGGKGDAAKGKDAFSQNCDVCHNADSTETKMGPGLKGLFKKGKLANGKTVNDANVLGQINEGGNGMPAYKDVLSDAEKANVLAYLKTL
jgi:mono/diheme cytochrome c family protein